MSSKKTDLTVNNLDRGNGSFDDRFMGGENRLVAKFEEKHAHIPGNGSSTSESRFSVFVDIIRTKFL